MVANCRGSAQELHRRLEEPLFREHNQLLPVGHRPAPIVVTIVTILSGPRPLARYRFA
jgi:hypothetical protein